MLIKRFIANLWMHPWEIDWFNKLGNEIMLQLASEVDPTDPAKITLLGHDTPEKRSDRLKKVKDNTKARMSSIAYGDYPGNPVSLALRHQPAVPSLASYLGSQISVSFRTDILLSSHFPRWSQRKIANLNLEMI